MPVEIYKVLHVFGILLVFTGLAGLWGISVSGGAKRSSVAALHGVGLLIIFVSGFGMAGKLGYMAHFPLWLIGKTVIWFLLGGSIAIARRKAQWGLGLHVGWSLLGAVAAYLAILKPF